MIFFYLYGVYGVGRGTPISLPPRCAFLPAFPAKPPPPQPIPFPFSSKQSRPSSRPGKNPSPVMSGSGAPSGRGSRSFDFGGDDVLCSYDDFAATSEPKRPDPADKVPLRSVPLFLLCSLL